MSVVIGSKATKAIRLQKVSRVPLGLSLPAMGLAQRRLTGQGSSQHLGILREQPVDLGDRK